MCLLHFYCLIEIIVSAEDSEYGRGIVVVFNIDNIICTHISGVPSFLILLFCIVFHYGIAIRKSENLLNLR
jgi:hypothetical protein